MRNSARKTFHFRTNSQEVQRHLSVCQVCLSRVTASLEGTVGLDMIQLMQHVARCIEANRPRWEQDPLPWQYGR
jgi:hypothetical protein